MSSMELDPHGQPRSSRFNQARRIDRDVAELLGLAKGMLADGTITESEAVLLRDWTRSHPDAGESWPVNALLDRLETIFGDGKVDDAERADLAALLDNLVGGKAGAIVGETAATALPLDQPPPRIEWAGSTFVFTGAFAFGTRAACESQVESLGGAAASSVTQRTRYLVIGTFGSRDWIQTSFGRKIEKAVAYRESGVPISIVAEDHWAACLP